MLKAKCQGVIVCLCPCVDICWRLIEMAHVNHHRYCDNDTKRQDMVKKMLQNFFHQFLI